MTTINEDQTHYNSNSVRIQFIDSEPVTKTLFVRLKLIWPHNKIASLLIFIWKTLMVKYFFF